MNVIYERGIVMIVLKADRELTAVFHKTIKVMEQNVEWNETFVINNNTLVLPGKLKSLFFSFDNKKVIGTVMDKEIKEEPRLMLDNKMLENAVNMVLYIFGKWGKIKGLTVEKDYRQLGSMINDILQEIDVQAVVTPANCRFYKDNVCITYEEVIELILEYMKPDYLTDKDDESDEDGEADEKRSSWEEKYRLGLWHRIVWKSYTMPFSKRELTAQEKKKARIGKDFYASGYLCPECKGLLYMAVYPKDKENRIETDEGRVILSRAYTCNSCYRFYTPKPYKLLMEASIYMMDFEEDENAYEDYLELMGQNAERTFNSNYNRYENEAGYKEELADGGRLAELYANMQEMSDEEIFDIADMLDSGFYPEKERKKYEPGIEKEMKKRKIDRNIPVSAYKQEKENETELQAASNRRGTVNSKNLTGSHKKSNPQTAAASQNLPNTQNPSNVQNLSNSQTAPNRQDELEPAETPNVKKAAEYAYSDNEAQFVSALDTMTEEELKSTCQTLKKDKYIRYQQLAGAKLAKKQQSDILNTALAVKGKSYQEIKQAYKRITEKDCDAAVKGNIPDTLKEWLKQRGEKEMQVIVQKLPGTYNRSVYKQFEEKLQEYSDIDNSKYIDIINNRRDEFEQKEIESFINKNPKKNKDRKTLLDLIESIKPLDYDEHNKKIYTDRLLNQVEAIDKVMLDRICPDVFELSFDEGLEAYKKISEGNFLPELKTDYLNRITKRLEAMKKDECRNLVNKLIRDTDWREGSIEGLYVYDVRRMSRQDCEDTDVIIVQNAVNTYAGGEKYEYPVLIYDSTKGSNGKKGFVLTPDHIYYNSSMTAGTVKLSEAEEFYIENGLFNKGIYIRNKKGEGIKLAGNIKGDKGVLEGYLKKLNRFLKYLKEKPESRNVEYLAQEKHEIKCCYRCGYTYKYGDVCPKCGSRNNS